MVTKKWLHLPLSVFTWLIEIRIINVNITKFLILAKLYFGYFYGKLDIVCFYFQPERYKKLQTYTYWTFKYLKHLNFYFYFNKLQILGGCSLNAEKMFRKNMFWNLNMTVQKWLHTYISTWLSWTFGKLYINNLRSEYWKGNTFEKQQSV